VSQPARETEPIDAATTDTDSTDVTEPSIGRAESSAHEDDAAVDNQRTTGDQDV
jgi:hypothetical protein